MNCDEFYPEKLATNLVLEGDGQNTGLRTIEAYCHNQSCPVDKLRFFEYIVFNSGVRDPTKLNYEELGMISEGIYGSQDPHRLGDIYEAMGGIENLINPDPSILDES